MRAGLSKVSFAFTTNECTPTVVLIGWPVKVVPVHASTAVVASAHEKSAFITSPGV